VGQFSQIQAEQIKQCVLDGSIKRFTVYETQLYIKQTLGISLSLATVKNYKAKSRLQAQNWIGKLAKSKRADYIAEYKARIDEVMRCQKTLWEIIDDKSTGPRTRVEACSKLLNCTEQLISLYDCLPIVNAVRDYGCGYDHDKDMPRPLYPQQENDHQSEDDPNNTF
jgi:hypothetical protein